MRRNATLFILSFVLALVLARQARADACIEGDGERSMRMIEKFARTKTQDRLELSSGSSAWICASGEAARLRKRIVAACTKILDRDGDDSPCITAVASAGVAKLGEHDVFAVVSTYEPDPLQSSGTYGKESTFTMLRAMKDPRAVALIVERWRAALPRVAEIEKLPKRSNRRGSVLLTWSSWRQLAAGLLGELGGADEETFLGEQAKATTDQYVGKACRDAAAAIAKRRAATKPAPAP